MSGTIRLLTTSRLVSPVAVSGQSSTDESTAVPSLPVSDAGECVVGASLPTLPPAKSVTLSNLVMPRLTSSDTDKAVLEPSEAISMTLSRLSESEVTRFVTWPGLVVPALVKSVAVPNLGRPAITESVAFLDLDAIGKSMTVCILASIVGSSVPLLSLDGLGGDTLKANLGLWMDAVPKFLAISSFVPTEDKFVAGVGLWKCARDLGIPLGLGLPLPGDVLVYTCPTGPVRGRPGEL